jgi:hypothetical protein
VNTVAKSLPRVSLRHVGTCAGVQMCARRGQLQVVCTPSVVGSALYGSPIHTQSVAVQEHCFALSVVLLKPEDAAVHGQQVDPP